MLPLSLSSSSFVPKTLSPKPLITPKTLFAPKALTLTNPSIPKLNQFKPLHCSSPSISPIQVADLVEKDYSFLESDSSSPKISRIIAAAQIAEKSRVLISFPTISFVDRVVNAANKLDLIVAVHESLFVLAMIKEGNDSVRCLQGGNDVVPAKFLPFDVVFACYFPGMGVSIGDFMGSVLKWCSKGARLVICFDQGRETIKRDHKKLYPDIATTDLPDKTALEKAAADHSFQITEFVDEPSLYLAVLKFCG